MATQATALAPESSAGYSLLEEITPDLYRKNGFRVCGLPADASASQIARRIEKIQLMQKYGGAAIPRALADHGPALDAEAARAAAQRLGDPERRLIDELFWFWPVETGPGADVMELLEKGDARGAEAAWTKTRGAAALHNRAVLAHAQALDREGPGPLSTEDARTREAAWQTAMRCWKELAKSDEFWAAVLERIYRLDDPRLTPALQQALRKGLPRALVAINASLAAKAATEDRAADVARQLQVLAESGFDAAVIEQALNQAAEPARGRVKLLCAQAKKDVEKDVKQGAVLSRRLQEQTAAPLRALGLLLKPGNAILEAAHDEVALAMLICQVSYGNQTKDWQTCCALLEAALPLARSASARARIEENLRIVKENRADGLCHFCGERAGADTAKIELKMFGNVRRVPVWNGSQLQWSHGAIKVPRCEECKSGHARSGNWTVAGFAAGLAAALAGCIPLAQGGSEGWAFVVFLVVLFTIGGSTMAWADKRLESSRGIRPESTKNTHPRVKELLGQGWQFGERPQG